MASTPADSASVATSTATMEFSSQPARSLMVRGIFTGARTERKIVSSRGRSRRRPEPPHFTTFFAGQPRLMSTASKPRSSTILAAPAITAGFAPKSCAVMGCSSSWKKRYRKVFSALRVMPSELVNSVISRPQPPRPRITRRKSVSVTPAMGASTAAGRMVRSRIWKVAGIIFCRRLFWFCCSADFAFQELIELQEAAPQRGAVGGPFVFAGCSGERGADGGKFGIQIVEVMKDHGFANHRKFWRAEFVLAVMADQNMLHHGFQRRRKSIDGVDGVGDGLELHHDVAEELTFGGVGDGAVVTKLVELPDVVKDRGGQQEIEVELRIMRGGLLRQAAEADDVLDQAAEIGVMHDLRGGCAFVACGDRGLGDDCDDEFFEPGILNRGGEFEKLDVEFLDIGGRVREKIGELDFFGLGEAELLKGELRLVAVDFDARLNFDEVVAVDVARGGLKLVPHARFNRAATVAELQAEIGLPFPGVADFLFVNEEKSGDGLFGAEIADKRRLHELAPDRLPKSRNFLWPFFDLESSGVALTS